ncbi:MAG: type II secretion system F family protein [Chloroflexi bacterium]|nr:type II secretion system F family protein [Chloroflexota bacterium]
MGYQYIAYTADRRVVKGKLSAPTEEAAANLLSYGGYHVVSLKVIVPFFSNEKLLARFARVKTKEIVLFSRELALLLESGTDIVNALELIQSQIANRAFRKTIGAVTSDIRAGTSLSTAMSRHPRTFPEVYHRTIAAGEQAGNLEVVLRQMADHLEKATVTEQKIRRAMAYPAMLAVVAVGVVAVLVSYVLPKFKDLYESFDAKLPLQTRIVITVSKWATDWGLYVLLGILVMAGLAYAYTRTPAGKYRWHRLLLTLPIVGRINLLTELSCCCRTMALLFKVGLPLPEIMALAIRGTSNTVMAEALTGVQRDLIQGEGLSKPMGKRPLFLPLMVQMVGVGEETGNLDNSLNTVAQSYEIEADERTTAAIGFIQPALIIAVAVVVGFIAVSMISAMYSIYHQVSV